MSLLKNLALSGIFLLAIFSCTTQEKVRANLPVIPAPNFVSEQSGEFTFSSSTQIQFDTKNPEVKSVADFLDGL